MGEVLVRYTSQVVGENGAAYLPQACGGLADDGLWEGWIEFVPETGAPIRSPRETEQPTHEALMYWAEGLTAAYLEGSLNRALTPRVPVPHEETVPSMFAGPAGGRPLVTGPAARPVLDPFSTYQQGEELLRRQLLALSRDNLVNIIKGYRLDIPLPAEALSDVGLVDAIVAAVRVAVR